MYVRVRTYVREYVRMRQTLYLLHNFVVRGDNKVKDEFSLNLLCSLILVFNVHIWQTVSLLIIQFHRNTPALTNCKIISEDSLSNM